VLRWITEQIIVPSKSTIPPLTNLKVTKHICGFPEWIWREIACHFITDAVNSYYYSKAPAPFGKELYISLSYYQQKKYR